MFNNNRQKSLVRGLAQLLMVFCFCIIARSGCFGQTMDQGDRSITELRHSALDALNRGDWESAAKLYRSAVATDGGLWWANAGLADVYRANGAWAMAAEYYQRAITANSTDSQVARLADICRQASNEQRTGVVRAETLVALSDPGWSDSMNTGSRDLGVSAKVTERRIPLQILFPRDQFAISTLSPSTMRQLEESVKALSTAAGFQRLVVEGHTCRCGSDEANMELGRKRAEAIRQFLLSRGVASADRISVQSFGASKPVETAGALWLPPSVCDRDEIHSQNRRVVIIAQMGSTPEKRMTSPMEVSFLFRRPGSRGFEPLAENAQVRQGDEVKLQIRAQSPLYAYAFHRGSTGKWEVLFPVPAYSLVNPLDPGRLYAVPTPDAGFIVDSNPGSEETYVYSSEAANPQFEDLIKSIQDAEKSNKTIDLLPPLLEDATPVQQVKPKTHVGPTGSEPKPIKVGQPPATQEGEISVTIRDLGIPCRAGNVPVRPPDCVPRLPEHPLAYLHIQHVE